MADNGTAHVLSGRAEQSAWVEQDVEVVAVVKLLCFVSGAASLGVVSGLGKDSSLRPEPF